MTAETSKIDLIIQYSLLVAGEQDNHFDQQLGPIHLLKYVYLADLFYSEKHQGEIFTNTKWTFYNFGPWSNTVHSRIEPALKAIMANQEKFKSEFGDDDWYRWSLSNSHLLNQKRREIPSVITLRLDSVIKNYLKDTPLLLDCVYKTEPMLNAAPNEPLNFLFAFKNTKGAEDINEENLLRLDSISNKKKKKFREKMSALRADFQKSKKESSLVTPVSNPRYDSVYLEGIRWLDDLAGDRFSNQKIIAKFSNDVWKSKTRNGEDVS